VPRVVPGNPETWRNIVQTYVTVAEVAPSLGLTEKALRQRIFRGQVLYWNIELREPMPADELEKFLAALAARPGTTAAEAVAAVEGGLCRTYTSCALTAPRPDAGAGAPVRPRPC
jgi:hypothetical protein